MTNPPSDLPTTGYDKHVADERADAAEGWSIPEPAEDGFPDDLPASAVVHDLIAAIRVLRDIEFSAKLVVAMPETVTQGPTAKAARRVAVGVLDALTLIDGGEHPDAIA